MLTPIKRILVVGGTGMLRGCVERLAENPGTVLTVLARRAFDGSGNRSYIKSIVCDYTDSAALRDSLEAHIQAHGRFDAAILWVHSIAPAAPGIISRSVDCEILHVLGSSAVAGTEGRTVTLGSIRDADSERWLTHEEISEGVCRAFLSGDRHSVVGELHPRGDRPS